MDWALGGCGLGVSNVATYVAVQVSLFSRCSMQKSGIDHVRHKLSMLMSK